MKLRARLEKLEQQTPELDSIEVWLYVIGKDEVSGPDGKTYTRKAAEAIQAATSGLVIDKRRAPHEPQD